MFGGAGFNLDRPPPAPRGQQALTFERSEQEAPLYGREPEARISRVDDFLRLLEQQLHVRVGQDGFTVLRPGQVANLLPDRHQPQVVLACTSRDVCQERTPRGMGEQHCRFVHDQQPLPPNASCGVPDMTADHVNRQRPEFLR